MRRLVVPLFFGLMLAWTAAPVWAYEEAGAPAGPTGSSQYQLQAIKRQQLGPALGVDQRTVDQLLNIDQRYQPQRQQLNQDMKTEFQHLQKLMTQPTPPEDQVRLSLQVLRQKRMDMLNLQQRQQDEEMAVLSPVQQARYLLYLMGLRRQMAKEARSLRPGQGGAQPLPPRPDLREVPVVRPTR
jgi:hypothetical protein